MFDYFSVIPILSSAAFYYAIMKQTKLMNYHAPYIPWSTQRCLQDSFPVEEMCLIQRVKRNKWEHYKKKKKQKAKFEAILGTIHTPNLSM